MDFGGACASIGITTEPAQSGSTPGVALKGAIIALASCSIDPVNGEGGRVKSLFTNTPLTDHRARSSLNSASATDSADATEKCMSECERRSWVIVGCFTRPARSRRLKTRRI